MAQPTGANAPLTCLQCKNTLKAYFEIRHINPKREGDKPPPVVLLCSIKCVFGWAYAYTTRRGMQGIATLKSMLDNFGQITKGR